MLPQNPTVREQCNAQGEDEGIELDFSRLELAKKMSHKVRKPRRSVNRKLHDHIALEEVTKMSQPVLDIPNERIVEIIHVIFSLEEFAQTLQVSGDQ